MARLGRLLLLVIACLTFASAVPRAEAQVVVIGPRHRRYYHRRYYRHPPYHRHYYRHHRY